jgi:hypothetical protein
MTGVEVLLIMPVLSTHLASLDFVLTTVCELTVWTRHLPEVHASFYLAEKEKCLVLFSLLYFISVLRQMTFPLSCIILVTTETNFVSAGLNIELD